MNKHSLTPFGSDDSFRSLVSRFFEDRWPQFDHNESMFPRVNISEHDKEVRISADVPGMSTDDITIELHDGVLSLSGKHEEESKDEGAKYYRYERTSGSFARSFVLPSAVDEDTITASMNNGVLTIVLPKLKQRKKKIEVSSGT